MGDPTSGNRRAIAPVLLGYRWAVLGVALLAAALGGPLPIGFVERLAALAPILLSAGVTVAAYRPIARPLLGAILLLDIAVAGVAVWLTGGQGSPFVIYLTAAPLHLAATAGGPWLLAAVALAVSGYGAAVAATLEADATLTIAIGELGLLIAVPLMIYLVVDRLVVPNQVPAQALSVDDRRLLAMLAEGHRYKEIADARQESVESAKVAIARLYRRLGANTRAEALDRARARLD